ncbi:MAG: hypothetical protein ACEY3D_03565 [Rickettsia sp.]
MSCLYGSKKPTRCHSRVGGNPLLIKLFKSSIYLALCWIPASS